MIIYILRHVTHNYITNFVEGLFPLASEAHCGYTSLHKCIITILSYSLEKFQPKTNLEEFYPW